MANEQTPNIMLELDKKIMADFEASWSEEQKAEWEKEREKCGNDVKKLEKYNSGLSFAAYEYAKNQVSYNKYDSVFDEYESANIVAYNIESRKNEIQYGTGWGMENPYIGGGAPSGIPLETDSAPKPPTSKKPVKKDYRVDEIAPVDATGSSVQVNNDFNPYI